jgi:ubiquinone/menaquinone biosynthesis C-methylase UbiE
MEDHATMNEHSGRFPFDYDTLADDYAPNRQAHPGVVQALIESDIASRSRVLDVGCGTGNYALALRGRTGCRVIGVDPSRRMLALARRNDRERAIPFVQAMGERLPFADDTFDFVFSVDVIHHVGDRPAAFREAWRLLRPGGHICTVTDSAADIVARVPLSTHFPETIPVELARYPAIATLTAELTAAGFREVVTDGVARTYQLTDATPYRNLAFSSLHLIPREALSAGLARLESALARGPITAVSRYTLVWAMV